LIRALNETKNAEHSSMLLNVLMTSSEYES
jgi:hypothetical protein